MGREFEWRTPPSLEMTYVIRKQNLGKELIVIHQCSSCCHFLYFREISLANITFSKLLPFLGLSGVPKVQTLSTFGWMSLFHPSFHNAIAVLG